MRDEKAIFSEAVAITGAAERQAFLDRACGEDAELRANIQALIHAHERAGTFLDAPPAGLQSAQTHSTVDLAGTTIGHYKLLERIGEGGMGVVYMAEQMRPVKRRVALKIIKPGLDTKQVIARFEAERQALAMMDHPNIAKVFEAGTTETGHPYFVMELVRGIPITDYCDQHQLTPRQRLELFLPVCQAVQHAHQKGIIHRDVKPNNVLVTLGDNDKPVPKVIDFGIAKATGDQRLTDRTLFTEFRQLIGTPLYMSPEQAEMSQFTDVDTRSDVYSLGVLLYELLTGTTPFDKQRLAKAAYDEVRRIIREEEPPRPSTRLSTMGDVLTTVSAQRQTDPKKLSQTVRGELDWIVMKALEKERSRRYETAIGLAHDVGRYLADQPVEACPPSRMYRLRKFARRNRPLLATVAVIAIVLIVATVFSSWQAVRATRARIEAGREADKQKAINDFLQDMLQSANPYATSLSEPYKGKDVTVLQAIGGAVRRIDEGALKDRPEIEAAVRDTIGETYSSLGERILAQAQQREALRLARQVYGPEHPVVAQDMLDLGHTLFLVGGRAEAGPLLRQGLAMQRKFLDEKDPRLVESLRRFCQLLLSEDADAEAEKVAREIIRIDPRATSALVEVLAQQHRYAEAESVYRQLLTSTEQENGADHVRTRQTLMGLAQVLDAEDKLPEAEAMYRRGLELSQRLRFTDDPTYICMELNLGDVLREQGKIDDANVHYRRGLKCAVTHPSRQHLPIRLAEILRAQGLATEADAALRHLIATFTEAIRAEPKITQLWIGRAMCYRALAEYTEAVADCTKAVELEPGDWATWSHRASVYALSGHPELAEADIAKAMEHADQNAVAYNDLAWIMAAEPSLFARNPKLAMELAERSSSLAPNSWSHWNTLGLALYRAGDYVKAIDALTRSLQLQKGDDFSWDAFFLAMARWRLGHKDEARNWYSQAVQWMDKHEPGKAELTRFRDEASQLLQLPLSATTPTTISAPASRP